MIAKRKNRKRPEDFKDNIYRANNVAQQTTPLFITWPRSGTHWIQGCLSLYSGLTFSPLHIHRPKVVSRDPDIRVEWRTEDKRYANVRWHHSHDLELLIETTNRLGSVYLCRDPVDAIFSHFSTQGELVEGDRVDQQILVKTSLFAGHFDRWVVEGKARTVVTYEQMQKNPLLVMKKLCSHFELKYNKKKMQEVLDTLTKPRINANDGSHTKRLMTATYAEERKKFQEAWGKVIAKRIITKENRPVLKKYIPTLLRYARK